MSNLELSQLTAVNDSTHCIKCCKYGLLTKHEVKMAGYWPSSSFLCLWTKME